MHNGIWIYGDHRNYFQDRVTLQLINRAKEMARDVNTYVGVVLIGWHLDEYIMEYAAHGADKIFTIQDRRLERYSSDLYTSVLTELIGHFSPEIMLISGSDFGREIAPRIAARLRTGISSDCISLQIDDRGRFIQVSPAYDGTAMAEIVTPESRPQIATVRPGVFKEMKHSYTSGAELILVEMDLSSFRERTRVLSSRRMETVEKGLEKAEQIVCVGKGIGKKDNLKKAREFALLIDAEIGCTRPLIENKYLPHDRLIGQTGKTVKPQLLFVFGASGAVQFTASIRNSACIVAVNRDPHASIFSDCDIGIVGDSASLLSRLIMELKK